MSRFTKPTTRTFTADSVLAARREEEEYALDSAQSRLDWENRPEALAQAAARAAAWASWRAEIEATRSIRYGC